MAGTDRIDVMFLHQLQISQKLFPCDCSSGKRIAVVAVGTFDLEVHTVDIDDISFDIDPAKADFLSDHFIRCGKNQRIQCRNGKVVDQGTRDEVMNHPTSDYTKKLLAAVPEMEGQRYV